ncbi:hypothetical protein J4219_06240 [Candidatus Woesearchaeota archaeon]|nr:hypothetical protein [Candidatus Woesearchaeota archaeon]
MNTFNLKHTLESGQFFRYDPMGEWNYLAERDKFFKIRQIGKKIEFVGTSPEHINRLFGLDQKYSKIIKNLAEDETLIPALEKYNGLRIMQRDPWETLVSFQCSIMSNIKKIKLNLNLIAKEFGKPLALDSVKQHSFPNPGEINDLDRVKSCATGFRARYIHAANALVDDKYFENLRKKKYEDAHSELMELPGVAAKVSDCICLFALDKMQAFPVDVWIERIMKETYPETKNMKNDEIRQFAWDRWGKNAGYAQQFLYHWARLKD